MDSAWTQRESVSGEKPLPSGTMGLLRQARGERPQPEPVQARPCAGGVRCGNLSTERWQIGEGRDRVRGMVTYCRAGAACRSGSQVVEMDLSTPRHNAGASQIGPYTVGRSNGQPSEPARFNQRALINHMAGRAGADASQIRDAIEDGARAGDVVEIVKGGR